MTRAFAIPVALAIAVGFHLFETGRFLQRTFFSMWLHELGHAVAAWLCGRLSFPGPWFTPVADEQSWVLAGIAAGFLAFGAWVRPGARWAFLAVLAVQIVCTLMLPTQAADQLILWAGDGGALLFGCALMGLFLWVPTSVRWGLLVIGAASFVDVFSVWLASASNADAIPFGANEGMGASDPSRLVDDFGWGTRALVNGYLTTGVAGLALVAAAALWMTRRTAAAANPPD